MADTKLSALTATGGVLDADLVYTVTGGASKKATVAQLRVQTDTSSAGVAKAISTLAAAQTASTTAGLGLTITADNAVAGSTNAGAAAGGSLTITAGNAAQKTSGNANGGDIILTPGTGVGTGVTGLIKTPNVHIIQGAKDNTFFFSGASTAGLQLVNNIDTSSAGLAIGDLQLGAPMTNGTAPHAQFRGSGDDLWLGSNFEIKWSDTASSAINFKTGLGRVADGTLSIDTTAAGNGLGSLQVKNVKSVAGQILAASTTAAAQTASTTAGVGLTITADNAVAGSTNAGAAAGGNITLTAGNAAQLTSGNANGGDIFLNPGTAVGSGARGRILGQNSIIGVWDGATPTCCISQNGALSGVIQGLTLDSNSLITWSNAAGIISTKDTGLSRSAAKVVYVGDSGVNNNGWIVDTGVKRVSSQFDKTSSAALADITGLSVALINGRTYTFEACLYTTSNSASGVQAAIAFSSTVTSIRYEGSLLNANTTGGQVRATASGTAVANVTAVTAATIWISGTITAGAAGNLTVQFAQNVSGGTASSVLTGSYLIVRDNP